MTTNPYANVIIDVTKFFLWNPYCKRDSSHSTKLTGFVFAGSVGVVILSKQMTTKAGKE
jgi:hypothetical protein